MLRSLIEAVAGLHGVVLLLAVGGLAFGESAVLFDLVVPGEVGMVLAGAAGAEAGMPLAALILAAVIGALAGDTLSYLVGRRFGPSLVHRWRWSRVRVGPKLERAQRHFETRGGAAVFVARWVGALRAVVPLVAGSARMPFGRFVVWDLAGVVSWTATVVTVGFVFGTTWRRSSTGGGRRSRCLSSSASPGGGGRGGAGPARDQTKNGP